MATQPRSDVVSDLTTFVTALVVTAVPVIGAAADFSWGVERNALRDLILGST